MCSLCDIRIFFGTAETYPCNSPSPLHLLFVIGKLWSRSVKLAYTLLNKLGTKNEQILKPGDRVRER